MRRVDIQKVGAFFLPAFAGALFFGEPAVFAVETRGTAVKAQTAGGREIPLYRESCALVVGNGAYAGGWNRLPGALVDAERVAAALRRQGFAVTPGFNLDRQGFNRVLGEFVERCGREPASRLLFYFSGHGYTRTLANGERMGYLVMANSPAPEIDPLGFRDASVDVRSLVEAAAKAPARHALFVFDSCFSATILDARERVQPQAITGAVANPVRQFITAGRAKETLPDRSVFTEAFLSLIEGRNPAQRGLTPGYVTGEELGLYLKTRVPERNPAQHPQFGTIGNPQPDQGDFVFAVAGASPAGTSEPANAPPSAPPPAQSTPSSDEVTGQGAAALPADPRPGDTWTEPGTGMELVWLPGGEFTMGTNYAGFWAEGNADEKPEHQVRLDGFWIGKSEVTQSQWRLVTGGSPSRFGSCGGDCPVDSVSWEDAQKYARKLAARTGLPFRLPTEAEWEYAARGGRAQQKWAGTEQVSELGEYAWYTGNGEVTPHPVCTKRVNRFGLCDMSGNVWEWCGDWYGELYYETSPRENPPGPPIGSRRIFRGGGWGTEPRHVRATNRNKYPPGARSHELGLRLVVPPVQR